MDKSLSSKDKEMINKDLDQMLYFGQFFVYWIKAADEHLQEILFCFST